MKKSTLKKLLILLATILMLTAIATTVNAATFTGEDSLVKGEDNNVWTGYTLELTYGEGTNGLGRVNLTPTVEGGNRNGILYDKGIIAASGDTYSYTGSASTIFTGNFYQRATGGDPNSNYAYAEYRTTVAGHQTANVTVTRGQSPRTVSTLAIEVYCRYSEALANVANGLGGNGTIDTDRLVFTNNFPTEINADNVATIIENYEAYGNSLKTAEQKFIDDAIAANSIDYTMAGATDPMPIESYSELYTAAQDYVVKMAKEFLSEELGADVATTPVNYDVTDANYQDVLDAASAYEGLNDYELIQNKVNELLEPDYPELLTEAKAYDFIKSNNVDAATLTKTIDEGILEDAPTAYDLITDNDVKDAIDAVLAEKGFVSYEARIAAVQADLDQRNAEEFVNKYDLANFDLAQFNYDEVEDENEELAEDIVGKVSEAFEGLTDNAKGIAEGLIGEDFATLTETAQDYLDEIAANDFIEENNLDGALTKTIANDIFDLDDDFEALSDGAKEKVLDYLRNGLVENTIDELAEDYEEIAEELDNQMGEKFESFDDVMEFAQVYLDITNALEFAQNYLADGEPETIVAGEEAWDELSDVSKEIVNEALAINGIEEGYPAILEMAKEELKVRAALKFINENLTTEDEEVIKEANNSNYQQILAASNAYNLLPDDVKDIVNSTLEELGGKAYPELVLNAQNIEESVKTGDFAIPMAVVLGVSILGIAVTSKKRK